MVDKNIEIAKKVQEQKEIWGSVRRAAPIQHIRRIMREKHVLNKDLAERLGVTEASVSRLLKGSQNLQLDTLFMLADALEEQVSIVVGTPDMVAADFPCVEAANVTEEFESVPDNVIQFRKFTRTFETPRQDCIAAFG